MSVLNSWCERLFLFSFTVLITIILLDYKFYFLPINGLWLLLYLSLCIIVTIWITFVNIQKLLQKTTPYDYNLEVNRLYKKLKSVYLLFQTFSSISPTTKTPVKVEEKNEANSRNGSQTPKTEHRSLVDSQMVQSSTFLKPKDVKLTELSIDERIDILVRDIEDKFISRWYNEISKDESFPSESKILMEGIARRVLQVSVQMDGSKLVCGALVILLKHLKEYRKSLKRVNKNGGSIESVYRYSHMGIKSDASLENFTHRLTTSVLREFISWELWNSLPCRLLVSILSKRFTKFLLFYLSQPGWLNYKILYQSASETDISRLKLDDYLYISLSDVDLSDKQIKVEKSPSITEQLNEEEQLIKKQTSLSSTPQLSPKRDVNVSIDELADNKNDLAKMDSIILPTGTDSVIEQALTKMITQQTAPILQRAEKSLTEKSVLEKTSSTNGSPKNQTPLKQVVRSEPVKIHSAKSSSKRWDDNNSELSNVSLGQDLLALDVLDSAGIQGFSGRRLWGYSVELADNEAEKWDIGETWLKENGEKELVEDQGQIMQATIQARTSTSSLGSNNMSPPKTERKKVKESLKKASPPSSIPHCLRPATTSATAFVTNTIKPIVLKPTFLAGNVTASTLHNMREFQQSTVNNVVRPVSNATEKAMHKIGDLQDEAVGVVEGIFDFGMAGIRKGLRLTGLQEVNELPTQKQNAKPISSTTHEQVRQSPKNAPKLVKLGHVISGSEDTKPLSKVLNTESGDSCWINPIAKESPNGYENQMLLEKSPSVPEHSEIPIVEQATEVPGITESNLFLTDSPEYEETADLASTISKLRSLLQQKSSESSLNTPAVSPMPIDDKSCPTPTEPTITDGIRGDGGMQRFARTVTGMFNTFKTALPGNSEQMQTKDDAQWIFVENETSETDLPSLLNSLLVERRDYCTIDTAYEAMDSLDMLTESVSSQVGKIQWDSPTFEDELDDLENTIPITKALLDVICECLQDTKSSLNQEPVMKALLILGGSNAEKNLTYYAEKSLRYINKAIGPLPRNEHDNVLDLNLELLVDIVEKIFPYYVKELFGHEDIKAGLKFLISSLQSVKINQDIMMQFFELICSQLIYASSEMSPTPSA